MAHRCRVRAASQRHYRSIFVQCNSVPFCEFGQSKNASPMESVCNTSSAPCANIMHHLRRLSNRPKSNPRACHELATRAPPFQPRGLSVQLLPECMSFVVVLKIVRGGANMCTAHVSPNPSPEHGYVCYHETSAGCFEVGTHPSNTHDQVVAPSILRNICSELSVGGAISKVYCIGVPSCLICIAH